MCCNFFSCMYCKEMRNLTKIFLKRHPKWSHQQANKFIISHFGSYPRILNIPYNDDINETNSLETIDFLKQVINDVHHVVLINNLFERTLKFNPTPDNINEHTTKIEVMLGSTGCLTLNFHQTLDLEYIIVTLALINYDNKCPENFSPRQYLEHVKIFLQKFKKETKRRIIFKVEQDVSSVNIEKTKYFRESLVLTKEKILNFFSLFSLKEKILTIIQIHFEDQQSSLYKCEEFFEKIFRKKKEEVTVNDFLKILKKTPNSSFYSDINFFFLAAIINENESLIMNAENNTSIVESDSPYGWNFWSFLFNIDNFFNNYKNPFSLTLSLKFSRILSHGKPWYMIFFDGLNYCSYDYYRVRYEYDTLNERIEEFRNKIIEHKIKEQNVSVTDFVKEFNEKLKNTNERLYFYDLYLYFEIERQIENIFSCNGDYEDYCMIVE